MHETATGSAPERLAGRSPAVQWSLILAVSVLVGVLLELAGIPAALFLGPMAGGVVAGVNGATVRVPTLPFRAAQGVVGVLIARAFTFDLLAVFRAQWPLFVSIVLCVLLASSVLGYAISRWRVLPGTTGVWGSSPGGATAMVLMADAFGADARLVAFMQYTRVVFVAATAAVVARLFVDMSGASAPEIVWFPPIELVGFGETVALVVIGGTAGVLLGIPAGAVLVPMLAGTALHLVGIASFQLPEWLLAASYALIGWSIGLGFTRPLLLHAARALPQVVASIVMLILFCFGLAFVLHRITGIDMLSAYLATSPGGMDSIAIIASASGKVDLPLVMALQMVRFFFVLLLGPPIARLVARLVR